MKSVIFFIVNAWRMNKLYYEVSSLIANVKIAIWEEEENLQIDTHWFIFEKKYLHYWLDVLHLLFQI